MKRLERVAALALALLLALAMIPAPPAFGAEAAAENAAEIAEESAGPEAQATVQESPASGTVVGFGTLELDEISMAEKYELETLLDMMPDTLPVYLDGVEEPVEVPVTWYCPGGYEDSNDFYFQFSPGWDTTAYPLAEGLDVEQDAPYIAVYIVEPVSLSEITPNSPETRSIVSSNADTIYSYLTNTMGLNTAAACGILANMYAESAFNPKSSCVDTNGLTSYGLCQWNGSRYTKLKDWCKSNGYDYTTINGQMHYLSYELGTKSYASILTYLKKVDNSATGAYNAAYHWCYYFERPASKEKRSMERGNLAKNTYWPKYSAATVNASATPAIFYETTPGDSIVYGTFFTLRGTVSCTRLITSVTAGVYNAKNEQVTGATATVNGLTYDVYGLDNVVLFSQVPVGSYTYRITAVVNSKTYTVLEKSFTVTARSMSDAKVALEASAAYTGKALTPKPTVTYGSKTLKEGTDYTLSYASNTKVGTATCTVTGKGNYTGTASKTFQIVASEPKLSQATYPPESMKQGTYFTLRGTITSGAKITGVTAGVYDGKGKCVTGDSATPNATSYNLYNLDNYVLFSRVPAGSYTYRVTATVSGKKYTLIDQAFKVTSNVATITNATYPPASMKQGTYFTLRGTIRGSGKITKVTAGVYNSSGKCVTGGSAKPNTTTYNLYRLDNDVLFSRLPVGSYTYRVTATVNGTQYTVLEQSFKVTAKK